MCSQCRHLQRVLSDLSLMETYVEKPTLPALPGASNRIRPRSWGLWLGITTGMVTTRQVYSGLWSNRAR